MSLDLERGANTSQVLQQLDRLLERYGSVGAIARKDQLSNWFVMNEMEQLKTMSLILPTIFLVVSAFLTNMVLGRLVATERGQIGLMKAFGYSSAEVGLHYARFVIGIVFVGSLIGIAAGTWLGRINTEMYADLFRFPLLLYRPSTSAMLIAISVSLLAALLGSAGAVHRAARLPPAQGEGAARDEARVGECAFGIFCQCFGDGDDLISARAHLLCQDLSDGESFRVFCFMGVA